MHFANWALPASSPSKEDTEDGATGSKRSLRTVLDSCVADGPMLTPAGQSALMECEFHKECMRGFFAGSFRSSAGGVHASKVKPFGRRSRRAFARRS